MKLESSHGNSRPETHGKRNCGAMRECRSESRNFWGWAKFSVPPPLKQKTSSKYLNVYNSQPLPVLQWVLDLLGGLERKVGMITKLFQAYRTAWIYPKAVGNSRTSVFIDRFLFIFIPIAIAGTAFVSSDSYVDATLSLAISILVLMISAVLTVATTRNDIDLVNHYLENQHNPPPTDEIAYEFYKATGGTDIPLMREDGGSWLGFGHIDPDVFVEGVALSYEEALSLSRYKELRALVREGYGVAYVIKGDPNTYIRECPRETRNAFPVTTITVLKNKSLPTGAIAMVRGYTDIRPPSPIDPKYGPSNRRIVDE